MGRVTTGGVELTYREIGEGDTTILCIHGWMTAGAVYDPLLGELQSMRARFVVVDLRGAGASGKPKGGYELETMAQDLWAVVDALEVRPILMGHSMGGQLAQLMATMRPDEVTALALLCPVPASGFQMDERGYDVFASAAGDPTQQARILDAATRKLDPKERARLVELASSIDDGCWRATLRAWTGGGFADRLDRIVAPTLAIATDDPFLTAEIIQAQVVDRIRGSRLATLPGVGHYPHVEAPQATAAVLAEFFRGVIASSAA